MGWRRRLDDVLDEHGVPRAADLPDSVVVDSVRVHHTGAQCAVSAFSGDGDRFDSEGNFMENPAIGAREVALRALGRVPPEPGSSAVDPGPLVAAVLEEPSSLRGSLAGWVRNADRAALGCLHARACAWFVDARTLAGADRRGEPQWHGPAPVRYKVPGRGVELAVPVDALRRVGASRRLLVVRARPGDHDDRVARRVALISLLDSGVVPEAVVCGFRSTLGHTRFDVDDEVLEVACSEAARDVGLAQRPSTAGLTPGRHCRWCDLLEGCAPGAAAVQRCQWLPFPASAGPPYVSAGPP